MTAILSNLRPAKGSRKKVKRIGRGQGSGHGGTSTRGHKGQGSRSGSGTKRGFEGGQMPLARRLPKFGFTPPFRIEYRVVNVETLQKLVTAGTIKDVVTPEILHAAGVLSKKKDLIKVLGNGELTAKLTISAHKFSKSAVEKITAAGGTTTEIVTKPAPKEVSKKASKAASKA
ncbi:MAG: 50S ribosomal protein L15 [Ignavibacteriales bacterium]|nr:50S ribosomal protein L15 [Ignavibacteriales bacterium]